MSRKFSVSQIINRATDLDILLYAEDGQLRIGAQKGVVKENILQVIREYKQELIAALSPLCSVCYASGIERQAGQEQDDMMYCDEHRPVEQSDVNIVNDVEQSATLTPEQIYVMIQDRSGIPLTMSEIIPISEEQAMKARVEEMYRNPVQVQRMKVVKTFDPKKPVDWSQIRKIKDRQDIVETPEPKSRAVDWHLPADHVATTSTDGDMKENMRELDRQNADRRALTGVGLPPIIPERDRSEITA